ncbi:hypothetical protein [Comamonas antarctica]|uniref:hypothetical protein n=1 Tax=Comamonas antarctica TaxID=2743470 RepID=UPI0028EE230A|nr:hypothetical protein [Comamonas antarctica]
MAESPLLIGFVVLLVLFIAAPLLAALGFADRPMVFLQLAFVAATAAAIWGVVNEHPMTEYAVWSMYGAGIALAGLMVWRSRKKDAAQEFEDSTRL